MDGFPLTGEGGSRLVLAAVAVAAAGAWLAVATPFEERLPDPVPPPKASCETWFRGTSPGGVLAGPWRFRGAWTRDAVLVAQVGGQEEVYEVLFAHPEFRRRGPDAELTWFRRFVPREPDPPDEDFRRAVHVLSTSLEQGTRNLHPWSYRSFPSNLPSWCFQGAFLLILGALAVSARRALRGRRPSWATLAAGFALFAGGLALRLLSGTHAPLHANQHGLEELDQLAFPLDSPYPGYYGRAQRALVDLLLWWSTPSAGTFFGVHAILGAAAAGGAGLLARSLSGSRTAGWAAFGFAAVSPHLVRLSTSESSFLWIAALLAPAFWGLVRYAEEGDRTALAVGGAGTFLVMHLQAVSVVFLALPAAAFLAVPRGLRLRRGAALLLLTVLLGLLAIPHVQLLLELNAGRRDGLLEAAPDLLRRAADLGNLPLNPATGPVAFSVLGLAGYGLLWWRRRGPAAAATAVLPLFLPGLVMLTCWTDMVRYQGPAAAWITVPAGVGVGMFLDLLRPGLRRVLGAVALTALTAGSVPAPWEAHLQPDSEALEYLFLDRIAGMLPQHGIMVRVPPVDGPPGVSSYFPSSVLRQNGLSYRLVDTGELSRLVARGLPEDEPVFLYRGLGWAWLESHARGFPLHQPPEAQENA
ncbi:MAG: hypothetical protein FJ098_04690, partial [Deltaproteobacteria bacterium]|nr:hypothetical protein [Deltaproteobacteria bacterium]